MIEKVFEKFPLEKEGIRNLIDILPLINEFYSKLNEISTLKDKLQSLVSLQLEYLSLLNINEGKLSKFELETITIAKGLLGLEKTQYIDNDKFESIPLSIRRRSILSDVNELYKKIEELSMGMDDGVTRGKLIEEGLKIVGQTGNEIKM